MFVHRGPIAEEEKSSAEQCKERRLQEEAWLSGRGQGVCSKSFQTVTLLRPRNNTTRQDFQ